MSAHPCPHLDDFRRRAVVVGQGIALTRWRAQHPEARRREMLARHAREVANFGLLIGSGPDLTAWEQGERNRERDLDLANYRAWNDDPIYGPVHLDANGQWAV